MRNQFKRWKVQIFRSNLIEGKFHAKNVRFFFMHPHRYQQNMEKNKTKRKKKNEGK